MDDVASMFSVDDYMFFYADYLIPARSDTETAQAAGLLDMDPRKSGPLHVLDLACGFGRIANRLALIGHQVTGVEYQAGFLSIARAEARANNLLAPRPGGSVRYVHGDMREIDYEAQFERVVMMFNSFGYFSDAENLRVLQAIARALTPGGLLGFDIANRDGLFHDFQPTSVSEKDGALMISRFSFDMMTGRLHNNRTIIRGGARRDIPFSIRLYTVTEIRDLLAQAGLALQSVYAEWDGSPLSVESPAMVLVAKKPE